jgi:Lamin Tail Domain
MNQRRLIFYILLNVFVSACVTLTILYWYDRNYRAATLPPVSAPVVPSGTGAVAVPTLQHGAVKIISVVGAGNLSVETVMIQYKGSSELDLTAWHIKDTNGNDFIFPPFKLFTNGAVRVHTASGTNTAVDLYWDNNKAVWSSGENVVLTDSQGNPQDSYPVP